MYTLYKGNVIILMSKYQIKTIKHKITQTKKIMLVERYDRYGIDSKVLNAIH